MIESRRRRPAARASRRAQGHARLGAGEGGAEHIEADGPTVFANACKMGLEGIVSKRKDSAYRSGRSPEYFRRLTSLSSSVSQKISEKITGVRREV
jgi:hypothetical protein